jgi:hypothetical protein
VARGRCAGVVDIDVTLESHFLKGDLTLLERSTRTALDIVVNRATTAERNSMTKHTPRFTRAVLAAVSVSAGLALTLTGCSGGTNAGGGGSVDETADAVLSAVSAQNAVGRSSAAR